MNDRIYLQSNVYIDYVNGRQCRYRNQYLFPDYLVYRHLTSQSLVYVFLPELEPVNGLVQTLVLHAVQSQLLKMRVRLVHFQSRQIVFHLPHFVLLLYLRKPTGVLWQVVVALKEVASIRQYQHSADRPTLVNRVVTQVVFQLGRV
ncbi:Uncharacterised protein [Acinetobacter baumannii]|nr:Uncharacterised protein [Acinetobacter baumannii]SSQ43703.1 Uncharacterised protein [Acinetobacter baumannii]SSS46520.1 Uncharacterised protein [Acinetobacter baumannii]SSS48017.1 Uncharacterised protein [Acinetobacter baumannii]SSU52851.1 Uncharacterised protein [Acinetobacter baumannii]